MRGDTRDPANYEAIAELLDLASFIDYMLVNFFVGNGDWIDNNVYAMRNRTENGAFRFYCWTRKSACSRPGPMSPIAKSATPAPRSTTVCAPMLTTASCSPTAPNAICSMAAP